MNKSASKSVYKSKKGKHIIQEMCHHLYAQWPVPSQMYRVPTTCGETHVIECGNPKGSPLILLHGASGNSASWMGEIPKLAKEFCVYAVDIPGQPGLSSEKRMAISQATVSSWLESLLESLDLDKVHIAGISLGGYYALAFGAAFPQKVSGMVLIAASGLAPAKISFILKSIPLMFLGAYGCRKIYEGIYASKDIPLEVFETGNKINKHFIPLTEGIPVLCDEELERITSPVLYIGGARDVLIRVEESCKRIEKMGLLWKYKLLEGRGHVITETADTIASFLSDVSEQEE